MSFKDEVKSLIDDARAAGRVVDNVIEELFMHLATEIGVVRGDTEDESGKPAPMVDPAVHAAVDVNQPSTIGAYGTLAAGAPAVTEPETIVNTPNPSAAPAADPVTPAPLPAA